MPAGHFARPRGNGGSYRYRVEVDIHSGNQLSTGHLRRLSELSRVNMHRQSTVTHILATVLVGVAHRAIHTLLWKTVATMPDCPVGYG